WLNCAAARWRRPSGALPRCRAAWRRSWAMSSLADRVAATRGLIEPTWSEERARAALRGVGRKRRTRQLGRVVSLLALAGLLWGLRPDPSLVRFADGSTAQLLDAESLVVPGPRAPDLVVARLEAGRARFDIVRDPARRFRVESGPVVVEVLGTQ